MATLPTRSFSTILQNIVAGIQGRASAFIDFSIGSPLRAIAEAYTGLSLWFQAMILQVLAASRLTTSSGVNVDTFVAQLGLSRLSAAYAGGQLTYARFTASSTTPFISVGATVQNAQATVQTQVIADVTNPAYNSVAGGYYIAAGQTSVNVTAQALTAGTVANVSAGTLTVPTTPITGVDTVTNASAWTGGTNAESDAALKARFALYVLAFSKGTNYGAQSALSNLNVSIAYTITDGYQYSGAAAPGFYYVVVDDGTGSPSSTFLASATTALQANKPLGVQFQVYAPTLTYASVTVATTKAAGYNSSVVIAAVSAAITAYITKLGLGAGLNVYELGAAIAAVPGVSGLSGFTVNGYSGDAATIAANNQARIMPGTIVVT